MEKSSAAIYNLADTREPGAMMKQTEFRNKVLKEHFDSYPSDVKQRLLAVREIVFSEAARIKEVGELEEALKWNQPSFLTSRTKSGTTIRIDSYKNDPGKVAVFFHCQTSLIESFREIFPDTFTYEKNRALILELDGKLPEKELRYCIAMALTYHLNRKKPSG